MQVIIKATYSNKSNFSNLINDITLKSSTYHNYGLFCYTIRLSSHEIEKNLQDIFLKREKTQL